jgi:hypothetical protein
MPDNVWYTCLQSNGKIEIPDRWVIPFHVEVAS